MKPVIICAALLAAISTANAEPYSECSPLPCPTPRITTLRVRPAPVMIPHRKGDVPPTMCVRPNGTLCQRSYEVPAGTVLPQWVR